MPTNNNDNNSQNTAAYMQAITNFINYFESQNTPTKLQTDSMTCLSEIANIYVKVGETMNEISEQCQTHGKTNLMSTLPVEIGMIFGGLINNLSSMWNTFSDYPLPDTPDEPIIVPPIDEPVIDENTENPIIGG